MRNIFTSSALLILLVSGCELISLDMGRFSANEQATRNEPVVCPMIAVVCDNGAEPIDDNNDGCPLECPNTDNFCATAMCGVGTRCNEETDTCEFINYPAVIIECEDGSQPVDLDNDGCEQECAETDIDNFCATAMCGVGTRCNEETDTCEYINCPAVVVTCEDGAEPIDSDNDGCAHECPNTPIACPMIAIVCDDGADPIDENNDGCPLECPAVRFCPENGDCGNGFQCLEVQCAPNMDCDTQRICARQ